MVFYEIRNNSAFLHEYYLQANALFNFFLLNNRSLDVHVAISKWKKETGLKLMIPQFELETVCFVLCWFAQFCPVADSLGSQGYPRLSQVEVEFR
jgi:hypothetical protein